MSRLNQKTEDRNGRPWPSAWSAFQGQKAGGSTVYLYYDDRKKLKDMARALGVNYGQILQFAVDQFLEKSENV